MSAPLHTMNRMRDQTRTTCYRHRQLMAINNLCLGNKFTLFVFVTKEVPLSTDVKRRMRRAIRLYASALMFVGDHKNMQKVIQEGVGGVNLKKLEVSDIQ